MISAPKEKDYTKLIDTADSIVTFVLKGIENVGSGLPGIGAVSVVLAAKDKFMVYHCYSAYHLTVSLRDFIDR